MSLRQAANGRGSEVVVVSKQYGVIGSSHCGCDLYRERLFIEGIPTS